MLSSFGFVVAFIPRAREASDSLHSPSRHRSNGFKELIRCTFLIFSMFLIAACQNQINDELLARASREALHPSLGEPELIVPASWYFPRRASETGFFFGDPYSGVVIILRDRLVLTEWLGNFKLAPVSPQQGFFFNEVYGVDPEARGAYRTTYIRLEYGPLRAQPGRPAARNVIDITPHRNKDYLIRVVQERQRK
jgi:hypothetical protein